MRKTKHRAQILSCNVLSDGVDSYLWDTEKRHIKINYPGSSNNSQFSYDGLSHVVKIVETVGGIVTSTKQFVWNSREARESRDAAGALLSQYFDCGQTSSGAHYFYESDKRGDIVGVSDSSGTELASFAYDPYGRSIVPSGSFVPDFGFSGLYWHQRSGLNLADYRVYSPTEGRWLSRDPVGERGGTNLYCYVSNNPINITDVTGLTPATAAPPAAPPATPPAAPPAPPPINPWIIPIIVIVGIGGLLGGEEPLPQHFPLPNFPPDLTHGIDECIRSCERQRNDESFDCTKKAVGARNLERCRRMSDRANDACLKKCGDHYKDPEPDPGIPLEPAASCRKR